MEINNLVQVTTFLNSILVGVALGFILDIFKILRITVNFSKYFVLLQDIIFCLISGIITIIFLAYFGDGYIRVYIIIGEILGFIAYSFSVSPILLTVYYFSLKKLKGLFKIISVKILRPIFKVFLGIFKKVSRPFIKTTNKINKINLKKSNEMLYNLFTKKLVSVKWKKKLKSKKSQNE